MKRRLVMIAVVLVGALTFGIRSAAAQTPDAATTIGLRSVVGGAVFDVPFAFIAGERLMPAGTYEITPQSVDWSTLRIMRTNGRHEVAMAKTRPVRDSAPDRTDPTACASFSRHGGYWFLDVLAVPGRSARSLSVTEDQARRLIAKLDPKHGIVAESVVR